MSVDPESGSLYTASYDGRVYTWDEEGLAVPISGASGPSNQVTSVAAVGKGGTVYTAAMDDTIRTIKDGKFEYASLCCN